MFGVFRLWFRLNYRSRYPVIAVVVLLPACCFVCPIVCLWAVTNAWNDYVRRIRAVAISDCYSAVHCLWTVEYSKDRLAASHWSSDNVMFGLVLPSAPISTVDLVTLISRHLNTRPSLLQHQVDPSASSLHRKKTLPYSFIMTIPLSVRPHVTTRLPLDDFSWNFILGTLKSVEKVEVWLKLGKLWGTLKEHLYVCTIIHRCFLPGWRNFG